MPSSSLPTGPCALPFWNQCFSNLAANVLGPPDLKRAPAENPAAELYAARGSLHCTKPIPVPQLGFQAGECSEACPVAALASWAGGADPGMCPHESGILFLPYFCPPMAIRAMGLSASALRPQPLLELPQFHLSPYLRHLCIVIGRRLEKAAHKRGHVATLHREGWRGSRMKYCDRTLQAPANHSCRGAEEWYTSSCISQRIPGSIINSEESL